MDLKDLKKRKKELIELLEDKMVTYISNEDSFSKILKTSEDLEKEYLRIYADVHKKNIEQVSELKDLLEKSPAWLLLVQLCNENKKIKNYCDIKYSIQNVISQISNLCDQTDFQKLITDIEKAGTCQKCNKTIEELKDFTNFKLESAKSELDSLIIEKMKDSTTREVLLTEIISKYDKNINSDSNIYDSLLNFYNELLPQEKKEFLKLLETFFGGGVMKIVDINAILTILKSKSNKFQGMDNFINSFKQEIKNHLNSISKSGSNIEWIFQL